MSGTKLGEGLNAVDALFGKTFTRFDEALAAWDKAVTRDG
jgi:hypothetical protein